MNRSALRAARAAAVATTAIAVVLPATPALAMRAPDNSASAARLHLATPGGSGPGAGSGSAAGESPAIVGPMLGMFRFGAAIGVPLGCQAGTSVVGSAAAEADQQEVVAPYIALVNDGCDMFAAQGAAGIDMLAAAAQPLSAINPYANMVLESGAVAAETYGEEYGETLAPLGPTIVGSGATLRWFEGR